MVRPVEMGSLHLHPRVVGFRRRLDGSEAKLELMEAPTVTQRVICRAADQSRAAVSDLIEAALVAELVAPGSRLVVISPWITDFPVIDNRAGQFSHLDAQWGAARIRLSSALRSLMLRVVHISVACRSGISEEEFIERLRLAAQTDGTDELLTLQRDDDLLRDRAHEKALIAQSWALHGSMKFYLQRRRVERRTRDVYDRPSDRGDVGFRTRPDLRTH